MLPNWGDLHEGIPEFLSPAAVELAWTRYQALMVEKLNYLIAGMLSIGTSLHRAYTWGIGGDGLLFLGYQLVVDNLLTIASGGQHEFKTPKDIAMIYARDPNSAPLFNYASMAHNNHFFFEALSKRTTDIPKDVKADIVRCFGSVETLKREMIVTAGSMFGPGFVWLVRNNDHANGGKRLNILTTYLAGSPYSGAHYRKQGVDMNTQAADVTRGPPVNPQVGAHGRLSNKPGQTAPGGIDVNPILCINTWEHVYLPDFGVGAEGVDGKMAYAESWWEHINWNQVWDRGYNTSGDKSNKYAT